MAVEYPFDLTEREKERLEHYTPKQKETYIMKKFIYGYRFVNWVNRKKSTQRECWRQMNDHLISLGYEPKKSPTSIHRIWDLPFHNLDVEKLDDFYGDILYL